MTPDAIAQMLVLAERVRDLPETDPQRAKAVGEIVAHVPQVVAYVRHLEGVLADAVRVIDAGVPRLREARESRLLKRLRMRT